MVTTRKTIVGFVLVCLLCLVFGYAVAEVTILTVGVAQTSHLAGGSIAAGLAIGANTWVSLPLFFHRLKFPWWGIFLSGPRGAGAGFLGWYIAIHLAM